MEQRNYSIKELENFTGIKAHTIRIWEKRYKIISPSRTDTNIRYYSEDEFKHLLNVSILNKNGYKISRIAKLNQETINKKIIEIANTDQDVDSQIENLILSVFELNEINFDKIIAAAIITFGFEDAMKKIISPFYQKIYFLKQSESINIAQEQFAYNLIKRKLYVEIDSINPFIRYKPKTFIMFLPNNDHREIEIVFYKYIIKKRGHRAIYVGNNVAISDLISVSKKVFPDYIFTFLPNNISPEKSIEFIQTLSNNFPNQLIFIASNTNLSISFPSNIIKVYGIENFEFEFNKILHKLYQ